MPESGRPVEQVLRALQERAKELSCLYRVEEILHSDTLTLEAMFRAVAETLPSGWQHPDQCVTRIQWGDLDIRSPGFVESPWVLTTAIEVQGEPAGSVSVYYVEHFPDANEGPFLKEERRLIDTIASRIGQTLLHRELTRALTAARGEDKGAREDWRIVVDVLKHTDQRLYQRLARKLLNRLSRSGVASAQALLARVAAPAVPGQDGEMGDENRPLRRQDVKDFDPIAAETFRIAADGLDEPDLLALIQGWLQEDRIHFLILALESSDTSLPEIAQAVERYRHTGVNARDLSTPLRMGLKVSLVRRLLTDDPEAIAACRQSVEVEDFFDLLSHTIQLPRSHGRLGGKASGLFIAQQVVRRSAERGGALGDIRVPKTWCVPSDGLLHFIEHNDLDDVFNWKYQDVEQVRHEQSNLLQVFKSSRFPIEFIQGLSTALDDLGERPLIVRSSSLLEDRPGSAFSGKYKSLFLANQGDKDARMAALLDAIAEVYASVFGPDPIQYRSERGLLDQHEEMGIMIQEVVGTRVGRYFLPAWAGVAFSHNELRWSPRIRRSDGLLRMVPGLGTRAVDRLADDYPVLAAPGQPGLRVNVSPEDIVRYSPQKVDLINLETNAFETVTREALLREIGPDYPDLARLVSLFEHDMIRRADLLGVDFESDRLVFTFDGLIGDPRFIDRMRTLLAVVSGAFGGPVDLEFASDGEDVYLLQCRRQSHAPDAAPAPIPRDLPPHLMLFSANRYITNGSVPEITHVVYVDPEAYSRLGDLESLRRVGRAVGRLNKILPKRQFVLMGPGRWGSRGDIRLGVSVTYSEINNTAVLVEIARKRGDYVPDLSFGTHFFQDLVESAIRYLPLYPDDQGVVFNEAFFRHAPNVLGRLLPEYEDLAGTLKVIDVPSAAEGRVLRILMNAELDEAVGMLAPPGPAEAVSRMAAAPPPRLGEDHWRWRLTMAQRIAAEIDAERFGVRAAYLLGSTKNATAGPNSDVDLLIHVSGTAEQRQELELWLEGWSLCLSEINYLRTGYRSEGLLDVHFVTDEDIAQRTSFAVKIGAVTDAARPLPLGRRA